LVRVIVHQPRRQILEIALQQVPARSRFAEIMRNSIEAVWQAPDWITAYQILHTRYRQYGHCRVFFECATLANTFRFAKDAGDAICKQVMQGNDTDSFSATAGSLMGMHLGRGSLPARWLEPFGDRLRNSLADYPQGSIQQLCKTAAMLPQRVKIP
jgi:hypothetical protein